MNDYDLISIGSGSAGRRAAVALKRSGWKTAIIEKDVEKHFGGTCICSGCIPTKALIEKSIKTGSYEMATEHKNKIVERIRSGTLRNVEEKVAVDVIRGEAKFVDDHTLIVGEKKFTSDIIVIATGSKPSIPPIKGLKGVNYLTSKSFLDIEKLPKSLLIIGAGRIGLEFGVLYHTLGVDVTIFEGFPQILPGEDKEMSEIIFNYLINSGIKIYKNRFVDEVKEEINSKGESTFSVILNDGPNKGEYEGDKLLVATGRQPNISDLDLKQVEVELDQNAIKVNKFLQTNKENIFAIGDVIGNPMFTNWASYQSGLLLENLRKSKTKTDSWQELRVPNMPRICFIHPEFSATGMTEEEARKIYGDEIVTYKFQNKWLGKSMIVDDWVGQLKGIGLKNSNKILGVHLWGERSGSLIQMVVFAMENNLGWKELVSMVYGHPVLMEGIYSLASGMVSVAGI